MDRLCSSWWSFWLHKKNWCFTFIGHDQWVFFLYNAIVCLSIPQKRVNFSHNTIPLNLSHNCTLNFLFFSQHYPLFRAARTLVWLVLGILLKLRRKLGLNMWIWQNLRLVFAGKKEEGSRIVLQLLITTFWACVFWGNFFVWQVFRAIGLLSLSDFSRLSKQNQDM